MKGKNTFVRVVAFIAGWVLIFAGGVTFTVTTYPGVALVAWSLTGVGLK